MTAPLTSPATLRTRIAVIDVMRGLVMLIMLFDHVRETVFLHHQVGDPMDAAHVDPALFFTRLAAHVCAPMFVFLTGLSAWLYAHPAAGPRSASGFLFKRGLLLVVLELVFVNFAWSGAFPPAVLYLQVIWVIGLAMMALAVLHKLPLKVLLVLGVAMIAGQHLMTGLRAEQDSLGYYALTLLLQRGYLVADGAMKIKVSYPLLPWIGVIVLGYAAGPLYARSRSPEGRRRWLLALGAGSLLLLGLLRGFNLYGETLPWVAGDTALRTAMSVLNFTKYPPSLDFLLFTLGLGLLGLAWLESVDNGFTRACATFGGAPMFYYLLHLYLLLAIGLTLTAVLGANHGTRYGVEHIWQVWLLALLLMPVLYFPCRAFANYKRTSQQAWVRYF
ncbi:hypothetical protein JAB5_35590 [Janthinobacterium sp. HH103]|uniref:DUF1624 domain-containing protein n=1 Tax=unclassified Janthinobacterium TaxID=2610881 RepID=UPI0008757B11|nr:MULTISPECIES: heparan-alpha-glucosaminide N-acetyltransferase domain-containing protein [unclassified Janthinobacterium]OEZ69330.1 hypothetical protein JAB2_13780 [Janthinobacterium sp. HH100]OEZ73110.1 hypothetical protein JAB5_35590 [Janthinobacterium sp. HH103]QOU73160.1 hypothetical protein JAB4_026150 [Janthinobacterium sp. HH102]